MPDTTQTRGAAIRRAQRTALSQLSQLDRQGLATIAGFYRDGLRQLQARWASYADANGFIQLQYLNEIITSIDAVLNAISASQRELLLSGINTAAGFNTVVATAAGSVLNQVAAVNAVTQLQQADGLQLSQRLWRNTTDAKKAIGDAVRLALVRGDSAHKAAREFAAAGLPVPGDVAGERALSSLANLNKTAADAMTGADNVVLSNAQRVFRTEVNRAHTLAYIESTSDVPDVIGYKFNLSRNHRRVDICDMHARANLYGLGRGVYPVKVIRRIFPAHPNTTSYITAVFADEVTAEDEQADQSRLAWLLAQSASTQDAVLGKQKGEWLREGRLTESLLGSSVSALKQRFGE